MSGKRSPLRRRRAARPPLAPRALFPRRPYFRAGDARRGLQADRSRLPAGAERDRQPSRLIVADLREDPRDLAAAARDVPIATRTGGCVADDARCERSGQCGRGPRACRLRSTSRRATTWVPILVEQPGRARAICRRAGDLGAAIGGALAGVGPIFDAGFAESERRRRRSTGTLTHRRSAWPSASLAAGFT